MKQATGLNVAETIVPKSAAGGLCYQSLCHLFNYNSTRQFNLSLSSDYRHLITDYSHIIVAWSFNCCHKVALSSRLINFECVILLTEYFLLLTFSISNANLSHITVLLLNVWKVSKKTIVNYNKLYNFE